MEIYSSYFCELMVTARKNNFTVELSPKFHELSPKSHKIFDQTHRFPHILDCKAKTIQRIVKLRHHNARHLETKRNT